MKAELPRGVELPAELRGRACLCERCFSRVARGEPLGQLAEELEAGRDYYIENGAVVFTPEYLTRRAFCCDSGCRHCPY